MKNGLLKNYKQFIKVVIIHERDANFNELERNLGLPDAIDS